jgi:uncharacterized protein YidB (DUF937 family)
MNSTLKKLAATVAVAGAITAGTAGAAFAADNSSGSTSGDATAQTARHPGIRHQVAKQAFQTVLDQLGVTKDELKAALKGGQTISQYATSLGKDPAAIGDALTQKANDGIDQAVANGKLTQERADTMKGKVSARVDKFLNRTWGQNAAQGAKAGANA